MFFSNEREWAAATFGGCNLGDRRLTRRLVDLAARQAADPKGSVSAVCGSDSAAAEAAYRLLRNERVVSTEIDEGAFRVTAKACSGRETILGIQDTTLLGYTHSAAEALGTIGGTGGGFVVHSTLAVDGDTREVIGLLDQQRWSRKNKRKRSKRNHAPYTEKEGYKWEAAQRRTTQRLGSAERVIHICDREAESNEYLHYQTEHQGRFVVRARIDRRLVGLTKKLWMVMSTEPVLGKYVVAVMQRGFSRGRSEKQHRSSRTARQAHLSIRAKQVTLSADKPIVVNVVYVREYHSPKGETPIEWMLLTREPVDTYAQAQRVVDFYATRWLIEEFHKAWKSGCRIEERRLQTPDNLQRLAAITAHIAVRLLQLRALADVHPDAPCDRVLDKEQWQVLFAMEYPKQKIPKAPPSILWAMTALATLAGWRDSKRTGRMGWDTLWKGWQLLQERVHGWRLAMNVSPQKTA